MSLLRLDPGTSRLLLRVSSFIYVAVMLSLVLWGFRDLDRQPVTTDAWLPLQYSMDLPGCVALISGNHTGRMKEVEALLTSRVKTKLLSPDFYLTLTEDCTSFRELRGYLAAPLSKEEKDFPIAYSMVIHEKLEMFERLLRAIYAPQNVYCVHVDQKSPEDFQKAVAAIASCLPNVFIASKLEDVVYASWYRLQADLNCIKDLLQSPVKWRYLLNTCGSDFPLKTNAEMVKVLKTLYGGNSIQTQPTPEQKKPRWQHHYNITYKMVRTDVKKSPPPISTPMFSGNAYVVVSRKFVEFVMRDEEVQRFMEWEKDTYSPDEHLWATLQRMPSVPGSTPHHNKYSLSETNALARVIKRMKGAGDLEKGAEYTPCSGRYRRHICVYGTGELRWLLRKHHLFANKFCPTVDDTVIRCLETVLWHKALGHYPLSGLL